MKRCRFQYLLIALSLFSLSAFSQSVADSTLLGLPGDNLDLYAVLNLFQKSKTIEEFEKSLNLEKTGINNMDLDLDGKVDFIKVTTKQENDDFMFVLQIAVSKTETQDVAVIMVTKDKEKKITMQAVGDEALYGKKHIVELKETTTPSVTPNPAYTGTDTVKVVSAPAKTTTVIVEQAPIVQYVYSPAYVPYYPPYYYGYYPPYFMAFSVVAVGIYWNNHAYHHHHGYGYHGNTTIIHNENNFNNYNNNSRNRSTSVSDNMARGNYNRGDRGATRPSTGTRPATGTRPSSGTTPSQRPSTKQSPVVRDQATKPSANDRSTNRSSNRQSNGFSQQSRPQSNGASRYSGGSRGGGGGGFRGGGGRRR
jgi:uncharacterized membrane protein YgcG